MWLFDKLMKKGTMAGIWNDVEISPVVARSIQDCLNAFYFVPGWADKTKQLSGLPAMITNYISTLATTEMVISCGVGSRAEWLANAVKPAQMQIQRAVQLAAAGGELVIRPYLDSFSNTICFEPYVSLISLKNGSELLL